MLEAIVLLNIAICMSSAVTMWVCISILNLIKKNL